MAAQTLTNSVRAALADARIDAGEGAPAIDEDWGETCLTPVERVFGWNSFEVLAFKTGNPDRPVNAIPPRRSPTASCASWSAPIRTTSCRRCAATSPKHGFGDIEVEPARDVIMNATRLDPEIRGRNSPRPRSRRRPVQKPTSCPISAARCPNEVFTDILRMPTVWVPHSYAACSQHARTSTCWRPVARDGLRLITGMFWDLGQQGPGLPPDLCRRGRGPDRGDRDPSDRAAFAALFRHYARRVKAFIMKGGADAEAAQEVAQEALIMVWRKAASFDRSRASAATWIYTIARNKRIDLLRRSGKPPINTEDWFRSFAGGRRRQQIHIGRTKRTRE